MFDAEHEHPALVSSVDYFVNEHDATLAAMLKDATRDVREAAQRDAMKAARTFGARYNVRYVFVRDGDTLVGLVDRLKDR